MNGSYGHTHDIHRIILSAGPLNCPVKITFNLIVGLNAQGQTKH